MANRMGSSYKIQSIIPHAHDMEEGDFVDNDPDWIDRRALERAGWTLEDPDSLRGEPFERALHPSVKAVKGYVYPGTWARDGDVAQIVYVPVGEATKTWANKSWQRHFPRLYRWFMDDTDFRAVRCHGVVFIKSDF